MLSNACGENVVTGWSWTQGRASRACERQEDPWRVLDRQLCSVAKRRAALDREELVLIREAVRVQLWRPLGMTSMREYLERRMGYRPQVAAERLRVAEALEALPAIENALDRGELSYSAVRELSRIATRKTEDAWLDACRGKNLRQVEEMIAEREPGDAPTSPPKPDVRPRRVQFELRPATRARLRAARAKFEAERGERLDDDELIDALCLRALEGSRPSNAKTPRPRYQVAVTVCQACMQGWQNGAGRQIAIPGSDVACASCDAEHVDDRGRVTSTIPAATRRLVFRRDQWHCTVPGCRSAHHLDIHHIVEREHGGSHEPDNLTLLCAGHHRAHHNGLLAITGRAPAIEVRWLVDIPRVSADAVPHVGGDRDNSAPEVAEPPVAELARSALRNLGFTRSEAKTYVARGIAVVGDAQVEPLIRAALRACKPGG
jgi:hypothetical protein